MNTNIFVESHVPIRKSFKVHASGSWQDLMICDDSSCFKRFWEMKQNVKKNTIEWLKNAYINVRKKQ